MFETIIFVLSLAFLSGLVLTSIVRRLAPRFGLVDQPDGHRKLHDKPTPLGGGLAVFLAAAITIVVLLIVPTKFQECLSNAAPFLLTLLVGGVVILIVGLLDDRFGLRGKHKLVGQIIAVSIVAAAIAGFLGLDKISKIQVFGTGEIYIGHFAIPLVALWLLGAVNSVNLLDGIDGLAAMLGIILSVTFAVMAVLPHLINGTLNEIPLEKLAIVPIAAVFAGSLGGFLRFNFPPARVFLGDAGSMLIGLVVGMLAIGGSFKETGTLLLAAPIAVWALPVLDSAMAVVRRKLMGRSIYSTDRSHLHHRLLQLLGSNHRVLGCVALCCAFTSAAALLSVGIENDLIAWISFVAIAAVFITTGVFGRAEALLLANRLRSAGLSLVQSPFRKDDRKASQLTLRLQGSKRWELLWETLTESADKLSLSEIRLDVNLPAHEEGFHALWRRSNGHEDGRQWRVELPLLAASHPIGGLLIVGHCYGDSACLVVEQLLEVIEPFEVQLASMAGKDEPVQDLSLAGTGVAGAVTGENGAPGSR